MKEISDAFPWRDATSVDGKNYGILYTWGAQPLGWNTAEVPGDFDISQYVNDGRHPGRLEHPLGRPVQGEGDDLRRSHVGRADDPAGHRDQGSVPALGRPSSRSSSRSCSSCAPGQEADQRVRRPDEHVRHGRGDHRLREPRPGDRGPRAKKGVEIAANHKVSQGVPAWSDNATLTKEGGAKKQDAAYEFINETTSLPWQARLVKTTGNSGTLSYDQAIDAGLDQGGARRDPHPPDREGEEFFGKLLFFEAVEDLDKRWRSGTSSSSASGRDVSQTSDSTFIYDPFDLVTQEDPYEHYRIMRDVYPAYHNAVRDFWTISRFEDVQAAGATGRLHEHARCGAGRHRGLLPETFGLGVVLRYDRRSTPASARSCTRGSPEVRQAARGADPRLCPRVCSTTSRRPAPWTSPRSSRGGCRSRPRAASAGSGV